MNEIKTVAEYVEETNRLNEQIRELEAEKNRIWEIAREFQPPTLLRQATIDDIVHDAVLWYPHYDSGRKWLIVRGENPNDYLDLGGFVEVQA